ncbi:hypothetical protein ABZ897_55405 [Nonomuraea sp. NPDC046802]|uniref:hypothetical protein n=1 Tax=Nonomuraea sp. NPDC046802 TaxID=3154919 RepID=UPI0033CA1965
MSVTAEHIAEAASPEARRVPALSDSPVDYEAGAMATLQDLRTALTTHHLATSIVFRDAQPCLLIAQMPLLVRLDGETFTWQAADSSCLSLRPGQTPAVDCEAAAAAVSTAITGTLVRELDQSILPSVADPHAEEAAPSAGPPSTTGATASSGLPSAGGHPELHHACEALTQGTLEFHDLSLILASASERASPAYLAGEALAAALNARGDLGTPAAAINDWVTAIWVCQGLVVLTDGTHFAWRQTGKPGKPVRWYTVRGVSAALRHLASERARRMAAPLSPIWRDPRTPQPTPTTGATP